MEYMKDKKCTDCGESDLLVLEFDHLEGKTFNISTGVGEMSWPNMLKEISKCEVVCANCHRRRTAKRNNSYRFRVLNSTW